MDIYDIKIYKGKEECETIRNLTKLQADGLKRAIERHALVKVIAKKVYQEY